MADRKDQSESRSEMKARQGRQLLKYCCETISLTCTSHPFVSQASELFALQDLQRNRDNLIRKTERERTDSSTHGTRIKLRRFTFSFVQRDDALRAVNKFKQDSFLMLFHEIYSQMQKCYFLSFPFVLYLVTPPNESAMRLARVLAAS